VSPVFPNAAITPPGVSGPVRAGGIGSTPATRPSDNAGVGGTVSGPSFADVLAQRTSAAQSPQFSRHALDRVQRRGIELDKPTLARLGDGLQRAAGKGARNAVVFVDNTAFVANVPSNTVITAVDSEHMREHVFTNIDSAVIA
jgi:flagellar operon protein